MKIILKAAVLIHDLGLEKQKLVSSTVITFIETLEISDPLNEIVLTQSRTNTKNHTHNSHNKDDDE